MIDYKEFEHLRNFSSHGNIKLIAVSKTQPIDKIQELYHHNYKIFGENKVQELREKSPLLPKDIEWHFIGRMQTNKVKYIAPFVSMIHSLDSHKLALEINKQASKNNRSILCLLQFHIAREETKHGINMEEAENIIASIQSEKPGNIVLAGVMGMATFSENHEVIRQEFRELKNIFNLLKEKYFKTDPAFREISMGMSNDYLIAAEEGSTMIRVGSKIFGPRNYPV